MKMKYILPLLAAALALPAGAAEFKDFRADRSSVSFVSKQMNVPVDGRFKRFKSTLAFDPAKPAQGQATLEIEIASIDTGSTEADEEVAGKAWFNTKAFPTARFESTAVKPLGANRFEVVGKMTIKGRTRDITAPVSFKQDGSLGLFEGSLTLLRADYGLGEGMWADFGTVANEIQIRFTIAAAAK